MSAPRVLVVYGSVHGQAEKVAQRIDDALTACGVVATVVHADAAPPPPPPTGFDGVVVGASVHFGRHQRSVRDWVRAHAATLNAMPSAFYSVSGAAGRAAPAEQAEARKYVDELLAATGWRPQSTILVGGCIAYTRYGAITRWMMRRIARQRGGPTDTSRDHEMTDWPAVDRFARTFADSLLHAAAAPPLTLA